MFIKVRTRNGGTSHNRRSLTEKWGFYVCNKPLLLLRMVNSKPPPLKRANGSNCYSPAFLCMAQNVEISGIDERRRELERLLTTNPDMRRRLQGCIREILMQVRKSLSQDAQSGLKMKSDPRKAYKAVRSAVYRRILGGQVNILQKRKAGHAGSYAPPRKGLPKRGGNRVQRTRRTRDLMGYEGSDRGFVLRFLNAGTSDRAIRSMGGHDLRTGGVSNMKTHALGGNRGQITARNWFGPRSQKEMEHASEQLDALVDRVLNNEFK